MDFYCLKQLVAIARACSPFYRHLYAGLSHQTPRLEDLPVADFESVMQAVHDDYRTFYTSEDAYGMCYTTSGTTGRPKATLFGRDEWRTVNQMLANMHWKNGTIRSGDVICSLSEPGSASFMAIHRVVDLFPGRCSEIPVGCDHGYDRIVETYQQFRANVIAGINPTLLGLAAHLLANNGPDRSVQRLLGGGELLIGAQADLIREAFPNAQMCSFMYGAAEAGLIGYSEFGLAQNQFRPFPDICTFEILDLETFEPIREVGVMGAAVVTSFVRLSTPVIRFMTGDYAQWDQAPDVEAPLFSLHGRMYPFVHRVGDIEISNEDIYRIVARLESHLRILGLQFVLGEDSKRTTLEARVWLHNQTLDDIALSNIIANSLYEHYPMLAEGADSSPPVRVTARLLGRDYFEPLTRRKAKYIVDERRSWRQR